LRQGLEQFRRQCDDARQGLEGERQSFRAEATRLVEVVRLELREVGEQVPALSREAEGLREQLRQVAEQARAEAGELEEERTRFLEEAKQLRQGVRQAGADLGELSAQLPGLRQQLDGCRGRAERDVAEALQGYRAEAGRLLGELRQAAAEARADVERTRQQLDSARREFDETGRQLVGQIKLQTQEILESDRGSRERLESVRGETRQAEERLAGLRQQTEAARVQLGTLQVEFAEARRLLADLQRDVQETRQSLLSARQEVEASKEYSREVSAEARKVEGELQRAQEVVREVVQTAEAVHGPPEPRLGLTADAAGVVVELFPDSAAEKAGLRVGDHIVRVNGRPVAGAADLKLAITQVEEGGEVVLDVTRGEEQKVIRTRLEAPTESRAESAPVRSEAPPLL
jgi:chromosome segregation ATPase